MADKNPEEFLNLFTDTEKWKNNRSQLFDEYPEHIFPITLKASTGKKAKLCLFEKINPELYDKSAKMVAFKTNAEHLPAWIRAAWLYFYDYLGEMNTYNINWSHDPPSWSKDSEASLRSININIHASGEAETHYDNTLLFRVTIFINTGLIEVQGNEYEQFQNDIFPVLLECVNKMMNEKQFNKVDDHTEQTLLSHDEKQSNTHSYDDSLNKSFEKTLIDTLMDNELDQISDNTSSCSVKDGLSYDDSDTTPKTTWSKIPDHLISYDSTSETTNRNLQQIQQFEDNISEALIKLKDSQEQFINTKVVAVMSSHAAILENHGKMLDSLYNKLDNFQVKLNSPSKSGHDQTNKKLENEVFKLNQKIRSLEAEKSDYNYNIQKLKSDYEMKVSILESEKEFLKQSLDKTKRQLTSVLKDTSQDEKLLQDKVEKKNYEILQLEDTNAILRKKLSEAEALTSNTPISSFEPVSQKYADKVKILNSEENTPKPPAQIDSPASVVNKEKSVLLVGTSIIRNIDPKLLSRDYDVTKSPAYSLEETSQVIEASKQEPDVVVFHSMTNNMKSEDPDTCVKKLKDIIDKSAKKWPSTKIMVSMETPRGDSDALNDKVLVANGLIRSTFYKRDNISIIDNSNMALQGQPIFRFLNANDKVHLSRQGTSILASNIRASVDAHFGLRSAGKGYQSPPRGGRDSLPKGRGFQPPGGRGHHRRPFGGHFPPWLRYRSPDNGFYN